MSSAGEDRPGPPGPPAPAAVRVIFTVIAGPHEGKVFQFLGHDTFIVGRGKQAHFRLPKKDDYFSRLHFLVEVNPPQCRLLDMGSTNGTHVNGQRVTLTDLHDGDLIKGGQTVLRVALAVQPRSETDDRSAGEPGPEAPISPAMAGSSTSSALERQVIGIDLPELDAGAAGCPVCGMKNPLDENVPTVAGPAICGACEESIRAQSQPIPGYRIVRELGRGGMGIVHLALRIADQSVVALKTIRPSGDAEPQEVTRFLREADILRQLDHRTIVAFREMGEASGRLFFAMDYVRGTDTARLVKKQGPLPTARAVDLVCQMLEALAYAHGKGFVHRDVKPANLLVTKTEDGREVARLADFGLARAYQASRLSGLTLLGQVGGTAAFMAPEQVVHFREVKPPADQYAAAATLYYLLTGQFLFDFPPERHKRLLMVLQDEPVPLRVRRPDVPEELARIVQRALAKEPEQRFADVVEMRTELWRCVAL